MSKVAIIGIDGGTFRVIDYLVGKGRMPNIAAALSSGGRATLMSSTPPLTPAAWASFYTGTNPGKHGVVDFFSRIPGTYKLSPVNATMVRGEPIWSIAGRRGKRVCVYNVPMTYPANPVNGLMISGMDSPRFDEKAVYPADFRRKILDAVPEFSIEPRVDVKHLIKSTKDPVAEYEARLKAYMEAELKTINFLIEREEWDLFVAVVRTIDIFQHVFWKSAENVITGDGSATPEDMRRAEIIFSSYERFDHEMGDKWAEWLSERDLILMSDHGFGELRGEVCLNRVLADAGLLKFRRKGGRRRYQEFFYNKVATRIPPRLRWVFKRMLRKDYQTGRAVVLYVDALVEDIDWSMTSAYSLAQFGCIFINLKGREPSGTVDGEDERQEAITRVEQALGAFRHPGDGKPLVTDFRRREELYSGPLEAEMPDLVITMRNHAYRGVYSTYSELSGDSLVRTVFPERKQLAHTGNHRVEGILIMQGPDVRRAEVDAVNMVDIAPTVLSLLGIGPPENIDGEVITQALADDVVEALPTANGVSSGSGDDKGSEAILSEEDEEEVRKHLEDLGYI